MKRMKLIVISLFIIILALGTVMTVPGAAAQPLTATRAVMINDYQIVIEFSEPIAFNLNGSNNGPWVSIRVVSDNNNTLIWDGIPNESNPLQWGGSISFLDSRHDKILYTMAPDKFGVNNISDIMNFKGELGPYSGNMVKMSIEEIPFNQNIPSNDGYLDNITTEDGKTMLTANKPDGWCGVYLDIEIDENYKVDTEHTQLVNDKFSVEGDAIALGELTDESNEDVKPENNEPVIVEQNDNAKMLLILGGSVVLAAVIIAVFIIAGKGGKKK